jgi:hypothetical protein
MRSSRFVPAGQNCGASVIPTGVVHPVCDTPDAFDFLVFGQQNPSQLTNELVATVEQIQLGYEPGVVTNISAQGHGAYS